MCAQHRLRLACAVWSESSQGTLRTAKNPGVFRRTAKTLISLREADLWLRCPHMQSCKKYCAPAPIENKMCLWNMNMSLGQGQFFFNVGHRSMWRSQVKIFVRVGSPCQKEPTCQIWRLYSCIWNGSKFMTNVIFFFKVGHRSRLRSQVRNVCISGKPLSQGTHIPNVKALPQTVQKLWPMLKLSNQQTNQQTSKPM